MQNQTYTPIQGKGAYQTHGYETYPTQPSYGSSSSSSSSQHPAKYQNADLTNEPPPYSQVNNDFDFGVTVESCAPAIRMAFYRKVYFILSCQIGLTAGVASLFMFIEELQDWVQDNTWIVWVNFIPTMIALITLICKRHSFPANFILISIYTVLQSITIGVVVSFVDLDIVLEAFLITFVVFLALTIFTLQTKFDFSGLGPVLFAGLFGMMFLGIFQIWFHNEILHIIYLCIGVLIFCGLIIYDTYLMKKTLSPDEYILAAINLYMDIVQLFLFILSLLGLCRNN